MDQCELDTIIARLPRGRTLFHYFKDRYALMLLESSVAAGCSVAELKKSRFRPLMQKPLVRQAMSRAHGKHLSLQDLQSVWVDPHLTFRLSLGQWPPAGERWCRSWHQMARSGVNLVVQLNLPQHHVRGMERLLRESRDDLQTESHPIAPSPDFTLAWSRIDFDREHGEVLVEEVQSDWVRAAIAGCRQATDQHQCWPQYMQRWLQPYMKSWSEAMLAATIAFVRQVLAPRRVFYYTYHTGNEVKRLTHWKPPRSLYDELPRRFCFRETHNGPLFLRDHGSRQVKRRLRDTTATWFVLDFESSLQAA